MPPHPLDYVTLRGVLHVNAVDTMAVGAEREAGLQFPGVGLGLAEALGDFGAFALGLDYGQVLVLVNEDVVSLVRESYRLETGKDSFINTGSNFREGVSRSCTIKSAAWQISNRSTSP